MSEVTIRIESVDGQPLALRRIVESHGLAGVAPWSRSADGGVDVALSTSVGPRLVQISPLSVDANTPGGSARIAAPEVPREELECLGRHLLGLAKEQVAFHERASDDPDLRWVSLAGSGAIARGATVFEDVIRTILTTNCAWSSTVSMCNRLIELLGEVVVQSEGRFTFPAPGVLAAAREDDLKKEVRVGYRAASLIETARRFAESETPLEAMALADRSEVSDAEVQRELLSLPGVGPYAAAHAMLLMGRPVAPILDSWTRPKYARLVGLKSITDGQILKRVKRHDPDAGLALWLILTKDWFDGSGSLDA